MLDDDWYDDHFGAGLCEFEACLGDDWGPRYPRGFHTAGRCRRCGCTRNRACRDGGQGCTWVNSQATLCSRCAARPGRRRHRRGRRPALGFNGPGWYWAWRRRVRHLLGRATGAAGALPTGWA